jgi:hypothetical protein
MAREHVQRFTRVKIAHETGVVDNNTFVLSDEVHAAMKPLTFTVCEVDGQSIAVFLGRPEGAETRLQVRSHKPDWLDEIVFADVQGGASSEPRVITVAFESTCEREPACAFATAVVVQAHGVFDPEPDAYLIRFARVEVLAKVEFDWDSESWNGTIESGPVDSSGSAKPFG